MTENKVKTVPLWSTAVALWLTFCFALINIGIVLASEITIPLPLKLVVLGVLGLGELGSLALFLSITSPTEVKK